MAGLTVETMLQEVRTEYEPKVACHGGLADYKDLESAEILLLFLCNTYDNVSSDQSLIVLRNLGTNAAAQISICYWGPCQ